MRPLDRLTNTDDGYALARIVVAVRTAIVLAIGVVLLIGPAWARQHAAATFAVLGAALLYAAIVLANAHLEVRRTRYSWLITALDSGFTLAVVALTGGAYSPVVSVPVAVIVASAARLSFAEALTAAVLFSAAFIPLALATSPRTPFAVDAAVQTGWWAFFVVCIAIITAGLSALAEREHRSRVHALVEAEAEHAAAEEERDLRARLLRSYQSQQDGLQVLVHEFRTPIASLEALMSALTSAPPMSSADRDTSLRLADRHVHHLADMIEALSDVALSRRPTFSSGRVRRVDVTDVVTAAADAVGLTPPRLRLTSTGDLGAIVINAQGLRRVLTNLLENACRHSRDAPVDVTCTRDQDELVIAVLDRGPGIPVEDLGELTAKYVSAGGQRGTAGLGLWIVQQIVEAMGGRVDFAARDGGGLAVTFRAPIES
ncbi:HAMP domain-containing histidine kinase [Mycolicibacterium crocinum]|uniref:histidine kinase n=1 Tax=Mycolicibacterium crocinum TaxID=388459 RepID=A0ABY3TGL8_9MYCO|nr:HAMP domain-containing sensor histidine kinase [Mycolicibacterium crocinum]ULN40586.1 HAMP domain-containing histidine kinase [Mycolicibacterium crocinum]